MHSAWPSFWPRACLSPIGFLSQRVPTAVAFGPIDMVARTQGALIGAKVDVANWIYAGYVDTRSDGVLVAMSLHRRVWDASDSKTPSEGRVPKQEDRSRS